jgi:hypothetical protein
MPYFSVMIPTRDRPRSLVLAVLSACKQTERDIEIVVSDNSTTDLARTANRRTVSELSDRFPIRYISPPDSLSMPDHWEWARRHAVGDRVILLTDRFVLRPSALSLIKQLIVQTSTDSIVSWNAYSSLLPSGEFSSTACSGIIRLTKSSARLSDFAAPHKSKPPLTPLWAKDLPRGLCCCASLSLLDEIAGRHGRVFFPLSPDYTSAFLMLAYCDTHCYVDRPLSFGHGWSSNGLNSLIHGTGHYATSVGLADWVSSSPIPIPTITNSLIADYLFVKQLAEDRFPPIPIDLASLLTCNLAEIRLASASGATWDVAAALETLRRYVTLLPETDRSRVIELFSAFTLPSPVRARLCRVKRWLRDTCAAQVVYAVAKRLGATLRGRTVYRNPIDAAIATDHLVWCSAEAMRNNS